MSDYERALERIVTVGVTSAHLKVAAEAALARPTLSDRGALSPVNSYRHSTLANMYGPKFDAVTGSTHTTAYAATANTIVR